MSTSLLMQGITTPTTGAISKVPHRNAVNGPAISWSAQATVTGTGAVTATVLIKVSNDGINFLTLETIILSGTTTATDLFSWVARYEWVLADLTAISGTGAAATVFISW